jgi:hypothetical protein
MFVELFVAWCNFTFIVLLFCSDVGDSPSDHVQEDMDSEVYPSEDGEYVGFAIRRTYHDTLCNVYAEAR